MVEEIYKLKNKIIQHVETEAQDMSRANIHELGELVDMVKDLAEAEKECWEASYYRAITEAMGNSSGYAMNQPMRGYSDMQRQGYGNAMGYDDIIEKLGDEYRHLNPEERTKMRSRVLTKLGAM